MNQTLHHSSPKFLIIRRDNIGDLVCTTPVFRALRQHFPDAQICALVNSYNYPVLENNPDIDQIFWYGKAKHQSDWRGVLHAHWERLRLIIRLRRMHFDYAILAAPGLQSRSLSFARMLHPKHIIGFNEPGKKSVRHIDISVPYSRPNAIHETEDVFRLLEPLGITGTPGPVKIFADKMEFHRAQEKVQNQDWGPGPIIGIHISARKPSQRWPEERFTQLIQALHAQYQANFLLFWSPGDKENPLHPGDDAKASVIMNQLDTLPILPFPTQQLPQLIAGLSLCDVVVCGDGGAMHLAAGLGKPILCFFGKSSATHWHPWGVPHVLIQPPSLDVADISVTDALEGFEKLHADFEVNGPERNS